MRVFAALVLLPLALAHVITVTPQTRECFHESLHKDDKMSVTFQNNDEIDFWLMDPAGSALIKDLRSHAGDHSVVAKTDGRYLYCFSNEMEHQHEKEVSFNVHGVVYVPEVEDPLEREVRALSEELAQVKDEQEYIVVRERMHRNTAESTNARVKYWNILQILVLGANCVFQIFYLRRCFETKRVV